MTTPLITKSNGEKFGKTASGAVWLDPNLMSPYSFYQFWLNVSDEDVIKLLKIFTFLSRAKIEEIEAESAKDNSARLPQKVLASEVTTLVHGKEQVNSIVNANSIIFDRHRNLFNLSELDIKTIGEKTGIADVTQNSLIIDSFFQSGIVKSKNEARRAFNDGGLYINGEKLTDSNLKFSDVKLLSDNYALIRKGKKTIKIVKVYD
jgi:tyrosyl-tRNA synthetase